MHNCMFVYEKKRSIDFYGIQPHLELIRALYSLVQLRDSLKEEEP